MDPQLLVAYVPTEWLPLFLLGLLILKGLQIWKDNKATKQNDNDEFTRDPDVKG